MMSSSNTGYFFTTQIDSLKDTFFKYSSEIINQIFFDKQDNGNRHIDYLIWLLNMPIEPRSFLGFNIQRSPKNVSPNILTI